MPALGHGDPGKPSCVRDCRTFFSRLGLGELNLWLGQGSDLGQDPDLLDQGSASSGLSSSGGQILAGPSSKLPADLGTQLVRCSRVPAWTCGGHTGVKIPEG